MNEKLQNYFLELNKNNKIGHAFLIGNVEYNNLKIALESIFLDYFFNNELKLEGNPDVFLIEPEKGVIKKEKISELHDFLNNTSQISGKKIYIIDQCELMNLSAANSLLKILEEPMENIYAFLLASNINNVLETIKSRCQNLFISSDIKYLDEINNDNLSVATQCVKIFEQKKENALPYINQMFGKKVDKETIKEILLLVENIYKEILNKQIKKDINEVFGDKKFICEYANKIDQKRILNILITLNKTIQNLNYNLNISLVIDKLVIDLGRC